MRKAREAYPALYEKKYCSLARTVPGRDEWMRSGSSFILDFGTHIVGKLALEVECDNVPDSPLHVVFDFAEHTCEFDPRPYAGGLSSSWIQRETVYADNPLEAVKTSRRYAFRYVKITFPANTAYRVRYAGCVATGTTSADENAVSGLPSGTGEDVRKIDGVGLRTLKNCMQSVFEDGPKRDRRLWLGDLYLQAKTDLFTYKNTGLIKRCLYLFAALPHEDGCLSSAVFPEPMLKNQSWILHDYALFFAGVLRDLYEFEKDEKLVKELWPVAFRQAQIAAGAADGNGQVPVDMYFTDWCPGLDKTCAAQGTAVAMLNDTLFLSGIAGDGAAGDYLEKQIERLGARLLSLFDRESGLFVCPGGQISVHSQMWGALSGVIDRETQRTVLKNIAGRSDAVDTVTPYAKHYLAEALFRAGLRDEAEALVKSYWGGMVREGADCFPEIYVPSDPGASPYGDARINSYCHAWSCTASYFIRKYGIV